MAKAKSRSKKKPSLKSKRRKLTKLMRGIDLCMMTTHGTDKVLRARPMSNNGEVDFDGDAWFFTWRGSRKVAELEKDDRVHLSYVGGTRAKPVWISVTGTAEIVDDEEQKAELWQKELERWFHTGPDDPDVVLVHVQAAHAHWWSYEDEGEVRL